MVRHLNKAQVYPRTWKQLCLSLI